jgi:hypothetical protein
VQAWHGHPARVSWAGRPCHEGVLQEPLELRNIRFIVATTEVLFKVSTVKLPVVELSELFLRMDEKLYGDMTNTQIVFKI